ncbi:probable inactive patatin-like protein 9 [Selaginella moellendorffii]|uniref:probable inactive patatin-like protein 9 n=1 Tax=Selaginella moellendorffii TaxID=88036 RepID=UPI000D1C3613|nr:probable inactive patatin-like protein 9 [Selaginella moellendorffii]XP_024540351.1 probable inactive patatin-like protein 9 [Selaginella moellendorffii]XP_024540352.1 probable inactive patatin-like protein 9 [Selaginella moellendorffii]|eukprot:XP_024540350.1 probable inactive patatin-like protein 9 [Selaginella moellendorffii]
MGKNSSSTQPPPQMLGEMAKEGALSDPAVVDLDGTKSVGDALQNGKPGDLDDVWSMISANGHSEKPENRKKLCILSLDGGGMRGLIGSRILCRLEAFLQEKTMARVRLCDYFDLLAGTSTGALIALMLATPDEAGEPLFTAQECCRFYAVNGRHIFQRRWYDPFHFSVRQMYRPKYSPRRLEKLLKDYLVRDGRELTLRDTLKPVLVTAFDISQATPFFFVRQAAMKDESKNFRLWEVCRATVAAPTYFRPAHVTSVDGKVSATLIDGAVVQNNPALVAVTHAWSNNTDFPEATGLQDVMVLSLGAGQLDERYELDAAKKWGLAGWMRPLLNIMMDGTADTVDYQLSSAFAGYDCSDNYLRIQLSGLPKSMAYMDCASQKNIEDLTRLTDELLMQKAVARNAFGEKIVLEETYEQRLSWFADQLIEQKKLHSTSASGDRAQPKGGDSTPGHLGRLVSPVLSHLLQHQRSQSGGRGRFDDRRCSL